MVESPQVDVLSVIKTLSSLGIYVYVDGGKLKTKSDKSALTPEVVNLIKTNKLALIAHLEQQQSTTEVATESKITKVVRNPADHLVLSYAQQRLWLLDKIEGSSSHYHIPVALKLEGDLNLAIFEQAFKQIIQRHESLRSVFVIEQEQPVQQVTSAERFSVEFIDLSSLDDATCKRSIKQQLLNQALAPFDLSKDLMLRVCLLKIAQKQHIALVTMHHIASDGWSSGILINEFSQLYLAGIEGREPSLPELPLQYVDYAYWQRQWLQGEVLEQQLSYWEQQLAGIAQVHSLPLDRPRPTKQSFAGALHLSKIPAGITDRLKTYCQAKGATLFMGLHGVFSVLLSRYSNEKDIVIGTAIANREQAQIAPLIGFFMNTLVLRANLEGDPDFNTVLERSKNMLFDAYAHQQVPFEQVVERLQPQRNLSHSPLFQVMLVLQNNEGGALELPGLNLSPLESEEISAKYELTLNIIEDQQGLSLQWEYNRDLFDEARIATMAQHFSRLLQAMVAEPQHSVFKIPMLSELECIEQLQDWNDTKGDYPHQL